MKTYPTIPKKPEKGPTHFWVFDKLDGSNIRAEWSKKRGFHKFGTRKRLLGTDQGVLAKAQILVEAQEHAFRKVFEEFRIDRVVCFFEFYGSKSFAGNHVEDDEHRLTLFDIDVHKKGLVDPDDFLTMFTDTGIDIANMLHYGLVDEALLTEIRLGVLPGMSFEGVVFKARSRKKWDKPVMFKVKNLAWIKKVKENYDKSKWNELL